MPKITDQLLSFIVEERSSGKTRPDESFENKANILRKSKQIKEFLKQINIQGMNSCFFVCLLIEVLSNIIRNLYIDSMRQYHMSLIKSLECNTSQGQ